MGSVVPRLKGHDYACAIFRQMRDLADASISRTGDIDFLPITLALDRALSDPEGRDAVIRLCARYIACSLTGAPPDLHE